MSLADLTATERLNFVLTNRIPRYWMTRLVGRLSTIRSPLFTRIGCAIWQLFGGDLELDQARKTSFDSLQECFTRELADGMRPVDRSPRIVASPCDGIIGAFGDIDDTRVYQAKGYPYSLAELLPDPSLVEKYRGGRFVTIRLRSNMYHRFHAPVDGSLSKIVYISGDTWNVNPPALKMIDRLFCKNERVVMDLALERLEGAMALVPVAAILVASIRFRFLDGRLDLRYRGPNVIPCEHRFAKGDELGHFELGSTILLFTSRHFDFVPSIRSGGGIRMGEPLMTWHGADDDR